MQIADHIALPQLNFVVRHMLWWKWKHPDIKHLLFSAWYEVLNVAGEALERNGIRCIEIKRKGDGAQQHFNEDDDITVFLLHGERESAGLTLTRASVVHLMEPVLKPAFELQAIGRVHRMGQDNQTHVYCYASDRTVEARIIQQQLDRETCIYQEAFRDLDFKTATTSVAKKGSDDDASSDEILSLIL